MRKIFIASMLLFNTTVLHAGTDLNIQTISDISDIDNVSCEPHSDKKHKRCHRGPRGHRGATGPTGATGAIGPTGATGGVIGDNFIYSYQDGQQFLTHTYTALTIPAANTPVDNGWTRPNDTDFSCHQTGTYLVIYRVVVFNISGSEDVSVAVKAEDNGTEIIGSQVSANLNRAPQISNSAVLTTSFLIDATSGDTLTFLGVTSTSTSSIISVQGVAAGGSDDPTGISVTITRVQ